MTCWTTSADDSDCTRCRPARLVGCPATPSEGHLLLLARPPACSPARLLTRFSSRNNASSGAGSQASGGQAGWRAADLILTPITPEPLPHNKKKRRICPPNLSSNMVVSNLYKFWCIWLFPQLYNRPMRQRYIIMSKNTIKTINLWLMMKCFLFHVSPCWYTLDSIAEQTLSGVVTILYQPSVDISILLMGLSIYRKWSCT